MHALKNATSADTVILAGLIRTFDEEVGSARALAIRDGRVLALGDSRQDLQPLIGPATKVVDARELVVIPAFFDTHNHQLSTSENLEAVDLDGARTIAELVGLIQRRAEMTPPGEWIVTSSTWHETNLAEQRLPTAAELDRASNRHPVLVRRGVHVRVANTVALARAGITASTPDPPGGTIVRDARGEPLGPLVEFAAFGPVEELVPRPGFEARVEALGRTCRSFNARGLAAVRDPGLGREEIRIYQALRDRGGLTVRSRLMVLLPPTYDHQAKLAELESWGVRTGFGDDWLRIDGIKILADGGVEGAALSEPYKNDPAYRGHLLIERRELAEVVEAAVRRGWRVGTHAVGDVAVRTVLDAYEDVLGRLGRLPPGWLTIEHAFFADALQRRRAIDLGVSVTVQYPLLYALAGNMRIYWGDARTAEVFPLREWLDEGAMVAAGSDSGPAPWDPLLAIWGMVTRGTRIGGHPGLRHAVDRETAFRLYTVAGARLFGEKELRGPLVPGRLADLVAFPTDPLRCPTDDLPRLQPTFTLVGGLPVHDPERRFDE